jgi:hypothetical protein
VIAHIGGVPVEGVLTQGATFIASKFAPENKDLGSQADPALRLDRR